MSTQWINTVVATVMIAVMSDLMMAVVVVMTAMSTSRRFILGRHGRRRPGNGGSGLVHHGVAKMARGISHVHLTEGIEALWIARRLHLAVRVPGKSGAPKQLSHLGPHGRTG